MPFTVEDFHDLLRLLNERPEWRDELRRVLFPELPELLTSVRDLSDSVRALEKQVAAFIERSDARMKQVDARLEQVDARLEQVDARMEQVDARLEQMDARLDRMDARLDQVEDGIGTLKGWQLEEQYRKHAVSYFGAIARRLSVLTDQELSALLEDAYDAGRLSRDDLSEIIRADIVARGLDPQDRSPLFLLAEVSWGIGPSDVKRASRRARLLSQVVDRVIPVAAGTWANAEAQDGAAYEGVWLVTNGSATLPLIPSQG